MNADCNPRPLLLLFAFIVGLAIAVRHWRHLGHAFVLFMLLFWIVPYSLIAIVTS